MERGAALMNPKHQFSLSDVKNEFMAQSLKEKRLLCESAFVPVGKWTLSLKMMETEVFLMKPKHQYHLS